MSVSSPLPPPHPHPPPYQPAPSPMLDSPASSASRTPPAPSSSPPCAPLPDDPVRSSLSASISLPPAEAAEAAVCLSPVPSFQSSLSSSLTAWKDSPLTSGRHLPPLRGLLTPHSGAATENASLSPPAAQSLPAPLPSPPVLASSAPVADNDPSRSLAYLQLSDPSLSPAHEAIMLNHQPALHVASSYSKASACLAPFDTSETALSLSSAISIDREPEPSDSAAEPEDSSSGSGRAMRDDQRASGSDLRAEDEKSDAIGKAGNAAGKRRWVRPAPIVAHPVSSSPPPLSQQLPAAGSSSRHYSSHKANQVVPFSPSSSSFVSCTSTSSPPVPAHRVNNLLSPSRIGASSAVHPLTSMSSSRALSPSGTRSMMSPPKVLRSLTQQAARSLSPSSAQRSPKSSALSSQLQLFRLSSIGQQHHLSPVFRADGEVEVRYLIETQRARRRYILRVMAMFVVAFLCVELLYLLMGPSDFWGMGWRSLTLRVGFAAVMVCYCGLLRYWSRFMVSPAAMDRSLLLLMTGAAVVILASTNFYIHNSSASPMAISLALQVMCVSLVLTSAFTYNILELPFSYSLTHSAVILLFLNLALIDQVNAGLFIVDQHVYANLWLATMLIGLLLGRRQQETSRHIDFDKKRQQFLDRKKSVKLLQSMLPPQIIHNYLHGSVGQISAVATIGFCTIKLGPLRTRHDRASTLGVSGGGQFGGAEPATPSMLGGHSPAELMQRLHDTFKRIDGIVNLYAIRGVSKIETVSQQYLLCSGLLDTVDDHAAAMIEVCLEILHLPNSGSKAADKGKSRSVPLSLQIGISTGSVVGGIIGTHRNFFKVFGDTVNVAARMCSASEGGCILISESTYQAMTDRQRSTFRVSERRDVAVKGKGTMGTRQVARKEEWVAKFGKAHRQTGGTATGDVKTAVLNQRGYHKLVQSTSLHPLTLRYRWDTLSAVTAPLAERTEHEELEDRFQSEWAPAKADLARRTTFLLALYATAVLIWAISSGSDWTYQSSMTFKATALVVTVVLIVSRLALLCTQFFVRYLTPIVIVWTVYCVASDLLLMATSAYPNWFLPSLGVCLNIITPTILFQLHFGYALPLALLSLLAYVMVLVASSVAASEAAVLVLLVVLTMCLSFFILSSSERDLRFNFLLHFAMELEQRQMDKFLNNLLPKFVADLLSKRTVVNAERSEREGSRLSAAGHARHQSVVDSPMPPLSPGLVASPVVGAGLGFGASLSSTLSGTLPIVGSPVVSPLPLSSHARSPSLLPSQLLTTPGGSIRQHMRNVSVPTSAPHHHSAHSLSSTAPSYSSRFAMELRNATVFESDIVGYTAMASTWTASHTLHVLNTLFSKFDEAAAACNVEKIETIGDAFLVMAADGPPDPVLDFALRVVDELRACNEKLSTGPTQQLEIRVGVCSGVCFGGVIGDAVPRFHLFGEAHDAAVAIEQSGRAGVVLVSESTWSQSCSRYVYECMEGMVVQGVNGGVFALKGKANNNVIMHDAVQRRNSALQ